MATPTQAVRSKRNPGRVRRDRAVSLAVDPARVLERPGALADPVTPAGLRAHWRLAFAAAQSALRAGAPFLTPAEFHDRYERLAGEREPTARLLHAFANDRLTTAPDLHLLRPRGRARVVLGLPSDVGACVFNLDGVLIGSAAVHARAWTETFDEFVSRRVEQTRGSFAPFNPRVDYPAHIHGRPRLEGVRSFLASRGIRLPEGRPDDPPGAETVHGLANRKNAALLRLLDAHGLSAFAGARAYLETAHDAGMGCAAVSASANMPTMLERAGLVELIDVSVDGTTIGAERLRPRPEPDILVAACDRLGSDPRHTAVFETSQAGIVAARSGGFAFVVGVGIDRDAQALREAGADLVVAGLDDILDRRRAS